MAFKTALNIEDPMISARISEKLTASVIESHRSEIAGKENPVSALAREMILEKLATFGVHNSGYEYGIAREFGVSPEQARTVIAEFETAIG
jgi:hypothetical protein